MLYQLVYYHQAQFNSLLNLEKCNLKNTDYKKCSDFSPRRTADIINKRGI